jgi:phosphatidylglycerophosphatase A
MTDSGQAKEGGPKLGAAAFLATLGPVGRLPAPGTWGSLVGIPWALLVWGGSLGPGIPWVLLSGSLAAGVLLCGMAEKSLGRRDPGEVIFDEFAAIPLCFIGLPTLTEGVPSWFVLLAGFSLFRVLDILKPAGLRRLQDLPGGWGVMADDVAAALATCALLHAGRLVIGAAG